VGIAQIVALKAGEYILYRKGWRRALLKWLWGGLVRYYIIPFPQRQRSDVMVIVMNTVTATSANQLLFQCFKSACSIHCVIISKHH